ncbi:MurR/RpiR family transcriptional regulator [Cohnella lubricantis]|uniref:MurR/RpiR family transcriptional regulator n=1 Tax=Cohnella lubricantis TaxID=2163172 RepID=A0A841TGV5_9BACL|nr:MurR/RpiR family transcriptional regulator [Cohnella lubricantis]MBB6678488.1 MurR/RpiR family transcriptional regulator [Cohnella lubricantis]MBP2118411.1 DNA-binding MurR/RpiR family transcriptional regulator [Cohnella lubricantis]
MDMKLRINSYYPSLTKSEQKVADGVMGGADDLIYHSVTELAEISGVGETTVMRFCRKIGFKGYQDFKLALAQDQRDKKADEAEAGADGDFTQLVYRETMGILQDSMSLLNKEKLEQVIDLIDKARHVQFFGVGASGVTAQDAKTRLLRIGRRAEAVNDAHIQAMMAVSMGEGDVAFGISLSGSTIDTNDILMKAKQSGAAVIAMTNYAKSPITSIADLVLLTAGKESPLEGGSIGAKISQLFLIDLICEGLARKDVARAKAMKEKTARAVIDKIY